MPDATPGAADADSADEARVAALEALLVERGVVDPADVDRVVRRYEEDLGPMTGAQIVARAWTDPAYRRRLLDDATAAAAELGAPGVQVEHLVAVENTDDVHNVVVCTLCSCYPWGVLGLPPAWYKDPAYRSRIVREPRAVLAEMGLDLPEYVEIRVWDSSAEVRYLVLPRRPAGSEGLDEHALRALVTRDSMVGVAEATAPAEPEAWS